MLDPKTSYFRYRITYSKGGTARFIGHLDLQSFFNKAFKRARLPVAYSQGFNPHQLLSIALPLSMGMAGHQEMLEIYLTAQMPEHDIVAHLNPQMPDGMTILGAALVPSAGKSAAGLVHAARYHIIFPKPLAKDASDALKSADFADRIINARFKDNAIDATLCAGSAKNLKPQVLAQFLIDALGLDCAAIDIRYERLEILI